jgi:hypothetical protein
MAGPACEGPGGCEGAGPDRGNEVLVRVRYQARVAEMAAGKRVPAAPNVASYLLVSRMKGWSNW